MSNLQQSLARFGLFASHSVAVCAEDKKQFSFAAQESGLLLVGNHGSSYWPVFNQSAELADGAADPLDRWSKRVAATICEQHPGLRAVFPSDGPPYLPFQRWALATGSLSASPLGLLIHPQYGLWHSFRFALLFDLDHDPVAPPPTDNPPSPCGDCQAKPCLHSCPVNAFSEHGYDFMACADYLENNADASCHQAGCQARNACPVGESYRYQSAQHRFHLKAFLAVR